MFMHFRKACYPLSSLDSADFANDFCRLPDRLVPTIWSRGNDPYSKRETVIHRVTKVLLAAKIALRRLHRDMPQKKLDLFQLSSGRMAEAGTATT